MTGRDHAMIDELFLIAQMAGEATFAALDQVARVVHPELDRFLKGPPARGVGSEPVGCRTVAVFAAHAVVIIKSTGALGNRDIQRMTSQAFVLRFGMCQA